MPLGYTFECPTLAWPQTNIVSLLISVFLLFNRRLTKHSQP